nr:preprotein translocase subunit SecE [Kribbia dieselivorans]
MGASRRSQPGHRGEQKKGFFGGIWLFISQVIDEMRKVVTPTRSELLQYTVVVIVFVALIMAIVSALDFGFTKLVFWVFAG